ncbi:MAG: hypothetical protein FWC73_11010 [Defluviitaleaceae bacterium]|nr:hypothetical protein [Defluviitaleaceae bacterium]
MDDKHAMLWQLVQSLGHHHPEGHTPEPPQAEHYLLTLRPLMPPRQQRIIDLMIKFQELKTLIDEIHMHPA